MDPQVYAELLAYIDYSNDYHMGNAPLYFVWYHIRIAAVDFGYYINCGVDSNPVGLDNPWIKIKNIHILKQ